MDGCYQQIDAINGVKPPRSAWRRTRPESIIWVEKNFFAELPESNPRPPRPSPWHRGGWMSSERAGEAAPLDGFCSKSVALSLFHVLVVVPEAVLGRHHLLQALEKTYFKCAHECFDRRVSQEAINVCIEICSGCSFCQPCC